MYVTPLRRFNRYLQITRTLLKYGFGEYVKTLHPAYLFARLGIKKSPFAIRPIPERIKLLCEELGPTFIKLGQIASTRTDIFPEEFTETLSLLQDQVKPEPFVVMKSVIENDIGPIRDVFTEFNETPIGSASIAQVYRARYKDTPVIVKVRRPNIEKIVELDIDMLKRIATLAEINIPGIKERNPREMIDTFARMIYKELDFLNEISNAERFRENFAKDPRIKIPKIFKELSTSRVLIQEYIDGIKITDLARIKENGINPRIVAQNGAEIFLKQILIDGFFHADPHPGNIFVLKDNVIVPVDFGMVGRLTPQLKEELINLVLGVINRDTRKIARVILKMGIVNRNIDQNMLQEDILYILDKFEGRSIKQISVKEFVKDLNRVIRRYQIIVPQDLLYLGKALSQLESIGRELDENFDIVNFARNFAHKHRLGMVSLELMINKGRGWFEEMLRTLFELPENINNLFETIKRFDKKEEDKKSEKYLSWYLSGFGIMFVAVFLIMMFNHPAIKVLGIAGIIFSLLIFIFQLLRTFFSY
ncbi:MAG: AarF/ABC1/UbiB kinase family protein [candidate division WOR-3 bacterium]|nr:AarF/ABC1/UbiB kinase family protein [candidate division WOR-3 bacterium]